VLVGRYSIVISDSRADLQRPAVQITGTRKLILFVHDVSKNGEPVGCRPIIADEYCQILGPVQVDDRAVESPCAVESSADVAQAACHADGVG
jgi:hypothetical protein